eukprot:1195638-Prorocentrum_minimum.AAC.5
MTSHPPLSLGHDGRRGHMTSCLRRALTKPGGFPFVDAQMEEVTQLLRVHGVSRGNLEGILDYQDLPSGSLNQSPPPSRPARRGVSSVYSGAPPATALCESNTA